ncbi:hypothetical protein [Streptomyces sp. KMM 9044]|nr:hypothetical protein [Streptomyces sp. KMM 9044]WAX76336.1 hypothetical protein HUV60_000145 [Streptomyces sp. KMM 9044]
MSWAEMGDHLTFRQVAWHRRARITPTIKERALPTNYLSEEQRRHFGHFT